METADLHMYVTKKEWHDNSQSKTRKNSLMTQKNHRIDTT